MSETFLYADLADIMGAPVVDGMVVPAAYGDQVRENLMALWTGETFRVSRTTNQTTGQTFLWENIDWATPAVDAQFAASAGQVRCGNGVWLVGLNVECTLGSGNYLALLGGGSPTPAGTGFIAIEGNESSGTTTPYHSMVACTVVSNFLLGFYAVCSTTISTSVVEMAPYMWGMQLVRLP